MKALSLSGVLIIGIVGCSRDDGIAMLPDAAPAPPPASDGGNPPIHDHTHTMSDVHLSPGGGQAWVIHNDVASLDDRPIVTASHFGVYQVDDNTFADVLDTTGTLGKKIVFPARDRVLLVAQRGTLEDVFVTVDLVARRPVTQRSYPGDRTDFRLSPSGRAMLSRDANDGKLHVTDTESLIDQAVVGSDAAWASRDDFLYVTNEALGDARLERLDLRTADLAQPLPAAAPVAVVAGAYGDIVVSPDDEFAAVETSNVGLAEIAMITLATGGVQRTEGAELPAFANDDRVLVFRLRADATYDLRLVSPVTGASTAAIPTDLQIGASSVPLRAHDLAITVPFPLLPEHSLLYNTRDESVIPMTTNFDAASWLERPGHDELLMWDNRDDALTRLDLTTGKEDLILAGIDSVDYRADRDDVVVGTYTPSLRRYSMATQAYVGTELALPSPSDAPAPYRLAD